MRRVLGLVLAVWVGLWILALSLGPVRAQGQQPIKVGALFILSGNFAGYGKSGSQGAQLAAEEINARGGVLGRPIQLVVVDDQGNPEVGVREARRLILQEKVDFLFGIDSSSVALAVAPLTDEYKIPLVVTHAATPHLDRAVPALRVPHLQQRPHGRLGGSGSGGHAARKALGQHRA
jgi:branched-chain amino acid transport system substrate-binding protein